MNVSEGVLRVLLVEDEHDVAAMLADVVRELGCQPVEARTAEEALRAVESERFDAILLDLRLPGMSGLDFLRLPRVRDAGIPLVAISGVATEQEAREALQLGALEFLQKPVGLHRLAGVLSFLELHGLKGPRRLVSRATVMLPVRVDADWEWRALDLSPLGMRIAPQAWLRPGARVQLLLALPDGEPPLAIEAVLMRAEPGGDVFSFVDLGSAEFERLKTFVRRIRVQREDEPGPE